MITLAGKKPVAKPAKGEEGGELKGCPPGTMVIPETVNCRTVGRRGRGD